MTTRTKKVAEDAKGAKEDAHRLLLSPFYHHAVNSVTKPNKYVFCSQYFVDRWMPLLGGVGTQIVLFLRRQGFYNRSTGELRDEISLEIADIAHNIGCAPRTVQYHLAQNSALQHFVHKRERFELDPRSSLGRKRQCENGFRIAMDDPVHENDVSQIALYIFEQSRGEVNVPQTINSEMAKNGALIYGAMPPVQKLQGDPGAKIASPQCKICSPKRKKETLEENTLESLNVQEKINFVAAPENFQTEVGIPRNSRPKNRRAALLDTLTSALVNELGDVGSEKRHRQLLDICERSGLDELPKQALQGTRRRLAQEQEHGVLEKPGAYYQKILIGLLEDHQVFVPPAGSKDEQAEVKRLARVSLGMPPGGTPAADLS